MSACIVWVIKDFECGIYLMCEVTYVCVIIMCDFAGDDSKTLFRLSKGFDYFSQGSEFKRFGRLALFIHSEN